MDLITLIGLNFILYILMYIVVLTFIDCDVSLWWATLFGRKLDYFEDKVVWITGASSGIGEFLAVELARNRAKVVLSARSVANLERVKENCIAAGASPQDLLVLPMDVTCLDKHKELFLRVTQHFGKLDILVNNAGRSQRAIWEDIDIEVDKEMFDLNVFAAVSLSRIAVKYFEEKGKGHIVITSSLAGIFGAPYSGTYTATKHCLHGYFKSLKVEKFGKPLDITLLCPGPVFSNLLPQCFTAEKGKVFGQDMQLTDSRMTTERCAYLSAVAIANKLDEVWIGLFPVIPLAYILVYLPNLAKFITSIIDPKKFTQLRDSRQTIKGR